MVGGPMSSDDLIKSIIKSNPVLPANVQLDLVKKWQLESNKDALDKLVLSNMKIVSKEAFRLKSKSMFDIEQDVTFLTYAMWWIKANMKRYVMDYKSVVKMGTTRDDRTLFSNLAKTMREAEDAGLSGEEMLIFISKTLSVKKESLQQMIVSLKGSDVRLDTPVSERNSDGSDTMRVDLLRDCSDAQELYEQEDEIRSIRAALKEIMPTMPEMERKIIENRFLIDEPKTLRELEKEMSISREWVRRVEKRAIDRIRKRLKSSYGIEGCLA
jgi:RNA polymerase sigma-32 factor